MSDWNRDFNNNKSVHIPWWVVIVAFSMVPPLGVALLLYKLFKDDQPSRKQKEWQQRQKEWFEAVEDGARVAADGVSEGVRSVSSQVEESFREYQRLHPDRRKSAPKAPAPKKPRGSKTAQTESDRKPIKGGRMFVIIGIVVALIFGIGAVDSLIRWLPEYPKWAIQDAFAPMLFSCCGFAAAAFGQFKNRQARKFRKMINLIGNQDVVDIHAVADAFPCSYQQACHVLQEMAYHGHLGKRAYVDSGSGQLILNGEGVRAENRPKKQEQPKEQKNDQEQEERQERAILKEIRRVNDAIPDPELTRKISRIEEITGHILDYQHKHPEKAGELHTFLNYYLPTTLKILNSYAELDSQGVEGENISSTKERIERMMDMVVEGFEKQLDQLFRDEMLDIASDISVMEKMMDRDGLSGDDMRMPRLRVEATEKAAPAAINLTLEPENQSASTATAAAGEWESGFYHKTGSELEG